VEILLVEDAPGDASRFAKCLGPVPFAYQLSVVPDGELALAFLARQAPYPEAPRPALIVLDIALPRRRGWEVLIWLRANAALTGIPVVMESGFFTHQDEAQREQLQPTLCLTKPQGREEWESIRQGIVTVVDQLRQGA
jgi:CheY-like chemotaxis protein